MSEAFQTHYNYPGRTRFSSMLETGDFDQLEEAFDKLSWGEQHAVANWLPSGSRRTGLIRAWHERQPGSWLAQFFSGSTELRSAWNVRGPDWTPNTPGGKPEAFVRLLGGARKLLEQSYALRPCDETAIALIILYKAVEQDAGRAVEVFDGAMARNPHHLAVVLAMVEAISPKWAGTTVESWQAFTGGVKDKYGGLRDPLFVAVDCYTRRELVGVYKKLHERVYTAPGPQLIRDYHTVRDSPRANPFMKILALNWLALDFYHNHEPELAVEVMDESAGGIFLEKPWGMYSDSAEGVRAMLKPRKRWWWPFK